MDGVLANEETLGDGVIAQPFGNQAQYLDLASGEQLVPARGRCNSSVLEEAGDQLFRSRNLQSCIQTREQRLAATEFLEGRIHPPKRGQRTRQLNPCSPGFKGRATALVEVTCVFKA